MPEQQAADEVRLLERACSGDASAYGELFELYAPRVLQFLSAHMDNHLDAEDMTEEVFLRVWRWLPGYREQGVPFGGFLFRVARNALIDYYRQSHRSRSEMLLLDDHSTVLADEQADPAKAYQFGVQHGELHNLLRQLRPDYRMVLGLRFLADLSVSETAAAMEKSPGAVRVLQHRALVALRSLLLRLE